MMLRNTAGKRWTWVPDLRCHVVWLAVLGATVLVRFRKRQCADMQSITAWVEGKHPTCRRIVTMSGPEMGTQYFRSGDDWVAVPEFAISRPEKRKVSEQMSDKVEWGRLPKPGQRCPVSGLSRSGLIDLGESVKGLLVRVKKHGAARGAVLVHYPTLRGYLMGLQEEQSKERQGGGR